MPCFAVAATRWRSHPIAIGSLVHLVHYSAIKIKEYDSMNFSLRSYEKELLDRDDIPFADIRQNMRELDFINAKLGGHEITLEGIRSMMKRTRSGSKNKNERLSILEIGCGGGDNLRVIKNYCKKKNIAVQLS